MLETAVEEARQKIAIVNEQAQGAKTNVVQQVEVAEKCIIQAGRDISQQVQVKPSFQDSGVFTEDSQCKLPSGH